MSSVVWSWGFLVPVCMSLVYLALTVLVIRKHLPARQVEEPQGKRESDGQRARLVPMTGLYADRLLSVLKIDEEMTAVIKQTGKLEEERRATMEDYLDGLRAGDVQVPGRRAPAAVVRATIVAEPEKLRAEERRRVLKELDEIGFLAAPLEIIEELYPDLSWSETRSR